MDGLYSIYALRRCVNMILSKCLNCKHTWLARKVDKYYNFVTPKICPRCKVKRIESTTVGNPTFKKNDKALKRVMGARKYD